MKGLRELLWMAIKPKVDALITRRILLFHDALIERKQIAALPLPVDPKEIQPMQTGL